MTRGLLNYDLWLKMHFFFLGGDFVVFVHGFQDVDLWCEVSVENVKPYTYRRKITSFLSSSSPPSSCSCSSSSFSSSSFSSKSSNSLKLLPCFRHYIVFPSTCSCSQYVVFFWVISEILYFPNLLVLTSFIAFILSSVF